VDITDAGAPERGAVARELANLFCAQARLRAENPFSQLWSNTDRADWKLARRVLEGRYAQLAEGIIDPSIPGHGSPRTRQGPPRSEDVHRQAA
jgi:hypothetical protein